MKRIRINIKEFRQDLLADMPDGDLMEKYGLSVRSLPKVKMELEKLGFPVPGVAGTGEHKTPISPRISINAQDFLSRFRETSDDFALMEAYNLNVEQLQSIYSQLFGKRLLSEFEFHHRQKKAPALRHMELPEVEETTSIDITQGLSSNFWDRVNEFGTTLGDRSRHKKSVSTGGRKSPSGAGITPRNLQSAPVGGPCPNCGKPMAPESPESCIHCGVVFAKFAVQRKKIGVAVWD